MDEGADTGYILGSEEPELIRLRHLSALYHATTLSWLAEAGLEPGMDVADLGCGLGDVTELVADLVGPSGTVIGVDSSARPLRRARAHSAERGLRNVTYHQADITRWQPDRLLDAVIGRLILMHLTDPVALLTSLAGVVRPGGLIAFEDVVLTTRRTVPDLPLVSAFTGWVLPTIRGLGRTVDMGLRLAEVFAAAGMPARELVAVSPVERGSGAIGYAVMAGDVTSLLPHMERLGIVTAREVVPATFEQRLRAEAALRDAVLISPLMVGASTLMPSSAGRI